MSTTEEVKQSSCSCSCCCKEQLKEIMDTLRRLSSVTERTEAMVHVLYEEDVDEDENEDTEDIRDCESEDEKDLKRPDTPPTKEDKDFIDDTPLPSQHSKKTKTQTKKRKIIDDDTEY